ncbi:MAG TPA: 3-dehydroquinate synthase, partial [Cellvibrio sp.]
MQVLTVNLDDRSYPIYIGEQLLSRIDLITRHITGKQVCVVTNETIAPLYLDTLTQVLAGFDVESVILPDGESYKTIEVWASIFDKLLSAR